MNRGWPSGRRSRLIPYFSFGRSRARCRQWTQAQVASAAPWFAPDSLLEGDGFELVWGFPCQGVFFGLLPVLCSEREVAVLHPVAHDQVPGARAMGSRDRNASKAWRLAA